MKPGLSGRGTHVPDTIGQARGTIMTTTPVEPLPDPDDQPVVPVEPTDPMPDPDDQPAWPGDPNAPEADPATGTTYPE
jgi:hypothetical protein